MDDNNTMPGNDMPAEGTKPEAPAENPEMGTPAQEEEAPAM